MIRILPLRTLSASPGKTTLPKRISLKQTLESSCECERAHFRYLLYGSHNVWFELRDGSLTKKCERRKTILEAGTEIHHRVKLVEGSGEGLMDLVQIDQVIRDEAGRKISDVCLVQILRR